MPNTSARMQQVTDARILAQAATVGATDRVNTLLAAGVDVNAIDGGNTALMVAAARGHTEIVRILLEAGADINARNEGGFTALLNAVFSRQSEVARILLENGADVHAKTKAGSTALSWASSKGFTEIVGLLLESGRSTTGDPGMPEGSIHPVSTTAEPGTASNFSAEVGMGIGESGLPSVETSRQEDSPQSGKSNVVVRRPEGDGAHGKVGGATAVPSSRFHILTAFKGRLKEELDPSVPHDGVFDRAQRWGKKSTKEPPLVIATLVMVMLLLVSLMSAYLLVRNDEEPLKDIPSGMIGHDPYESSVPARRPPGGKNKESIQLAPQIKAPTTSSAVPSTARRSLSVKNETLITEPGSSKKRVRLGEEGVSAKTNPPARGEDETARREDRPQRTQSSDVNSQRQAIAASSAKQPRDTSPPLVSSAPTHSSTSPLSPSKKTVIRWP